LTTSQCNYNVTGMSCGHCALSVREGVAEVAGVEEVIGGSGGDAGD
jgi:copper chaperone